MTKKFFDRVGISAAEAYDESYSSAYDYENDANYIGGITDSLSEAMECLRVTLEINKIVASNKNKLSTEAINLASIAINNNIDRTIPKNKIKVSTESIATEGVVDAISGFLKKIWDAIVSAGTWIYEKIAAFFKILTTNHRNRNEKEVISEARKSAEKEKKDNPITKEKQTNEPKKEKNSSGVPANTVSSDYCENIELLNNLNCGYEQIDKEALLALLEGMKKNAASVNGVVKALYEYYGDTVIKTLNEAIVAPGGVLANKTLSSKDVVSTIEKLYEGLSELITKNFEELSQSDSLIKSIIYQIDKEYPTTPKIHSNIYKMYGNKFLGNMALTTIMYLRDTDKLGIKNNIFILSDEYLGKEHIPKKYKIHEPNLFLPTDDYIAVLINYDLIVNSIDDDIEEAKKYFDGLLDYDKQQRKGINDILEIFPHIFNENEKELADNYKDLITGILEILRKILEILNNLVLKSTVYITKSREALIQYIGLRTKYGESV